MILTPPALKFVGLSYKSPSSGNRRGGGNRGDNGGDIVVSNGGGVLGNGINGDVFGNGW